MILTKEKLENAITEIDETRDLLEEFAVGLGFEDGEPVFLRLLPPKNFDPNNPTHQSEFPGCWYVNKKTGKNEKSSRRLVVRDDKIFTSNKNGESWVSNDPTGYLLVQNQRGFCPYIVVNPGGHDAASITGAQVIFWECDDRPKTDQIQNFRDYNNLWGGGMAVETKNSIHAYTRLDKKLEPSSIQPTQLRVIQLMGSDPSINDPSRLMRLPGFDHIEMVCCDDGTWIAERFPITLVQPWDGSFASWDKVDAALPKLDPEVKRAAIAQNETKDRLDRYRREFPGDHKTDELALDALRIMD